MKRMIALAAVLALTFAMPAFAQDPPAEPAAPVETQEPAEEPVEAPPEPEPVADAVVEPEPEPPTFLTPLLPLVDLINVEPEPVEAAPEPPVAKPEPVTLADAFSALMTAITAGGSHAVTVEAANKNLTEARGALATAEDQHAAAMDGQATVETGIGEAAQALVDHLRSAFGVN